MNLIKKIKRFLRKKRLSSLPGVQIASCIHADWNRINANATHQLTIKAGVHFEGQWQILFEKDEANVQIGSNVFFGASRILCANSVEIGDGAMISWGCTLIDHDSHSLDWRDRIEDMRNLQKEQPKNWAKVRKAPIKIGRNVWLGFGVTVLKGVNIGEGSVLGAQSVVTKDIPPYCLAAGNPAKVIRRLEEPPN